MAITRLDNYCSNITMETIFVNLENSKTNELHTFIPNLSHRLYSLKSSNKYVPLQNLFFHYKWKNIRQQNKNKLKIIAPT